MSLIHISVKAININLPANHPILEKCRPLYELSLIHILIIAGSVIAEAAAIFGFHDFIAQIWDGEGTAGRVFLIPPIALELSQKKEFTGGFCACFSVSEYIDVFCFQDPCF